MRGQVTAAAVGSIGPVLFPELPCSSHAAKTDRTRIRPSRPGAAGTPEGTWISADGVGLSAGPRARPHLSEIPSHPLAGLGSDPGGRKAAHQALARGTRGASPRPVFRLRAAHRAGIPRKGGVYSSPPREGRMGGAAGRLEMVKRARLHGKRAGTGGRGQSDPRESHHASRRPAHEIMRTPEAMEAARQTKRAGKAAESLKGRDSALPCWLKIREELWLHWNP